jgi:hypothetical protein
MRRRRRGPAGCFSDDRSAGTGQSVGGFGPAEQFFDLPTAPLADFVLDSFRVPAHPRANLDALFMSFSITFGLPADGAVFERHVWQGFLSVLLDLAPRATPLLANELRPTLRLAGGALYSKQPVRSCRSYKQIDV